MKRISLTLLAGLVLAVGGYWGYQRITSAPQTAPALQSTPARIGSLVSTISTTGSVVATRQAKLSFASSGKLAELNVAVGDGVKAGQQLAKLDQQALQIKLAQAESSLRSSQIKLQQLKETATPEEIAAATAAYEAAQTKQQEIMAGPTELDRKSAQGAVDQAKATLASAQAKLDQVKAGASQTDLISAQATVDSARASVKSAQAKLDQVKAGPTVSDLASAQATVESAKNSLTTAEDKYQMVQGGDLSGSGATSNSAAKQSYEYAKANYESAVQKLAALQAGPTATDLQSAQSGYDSAKASYDSALAKLDQLKQGALATDIASAQSSVDSATVSLATAQAKLDDLLAGPKASEVQSAASTLASAQAQLALKTAGPKGSELALAQEQVMQSEIAVQQAKLDLQNSALTAPFEGVVSAVVPNVGELVSGAAITLVDPKMFRIDVTVDETDVAKLALGQQATVTFDALPDFRLTGKVAVLSPSGTTSQGIVSYLVSIGIDSPRRSLPAGMTAAVSIETERRDNVLLVPNRALRTQGRNRTVEVMAGGKPETRTVQTGASNDQFTQITSGIKEGELVVIPVTTTVQPRTNFGPGGPPQPAMKVVR